MGEENKPPVNVDIGVSAKAEIKAEVPAKSVGNLIDALTDAIRPFTEARGLKADQIRLQREEVLIEVAKRARQRADVERAELGPIPNKFLVPFLEKASNEELGNSLIDWWASLLCSAAQDQEFQHPIFVDYLSKLTREEAAFLERLWNEVGQTAEEGHPVRMLERELMGRLNAEKQIMQKDIYDSKIDGIVESAMASVRRKGLFVSYIRYPSSAEFRTLEVEMASEDLFNTCFSLGIINKNNFGFPILTPFIGQFNVFGEVYFFSSSGKKFMSACH
ncbi:MAG: hypothetical protein CML30_14020 [Rhizobiales bacterium]|nr:hypothetical protein [Hyphomicrobiales bacterium]|tara:strand:+ start:30 stop:857 length:828 start_codon:yes stop_codon:yes gene_type:complete